MNEITARLETIQNELKSAKELPGKLRAEGMTEARVRIREQATLHYIARLVQERSVLTATLEEMTTAPEVKERVFTPKVRKQEPEPEPVAEKIVATPKKVKKLHHSTVKRLRKEIAGYQSIIEASRETLTGAALDTRLATLTDSIGERMKQLEDAGEILYPEDKVRLDGASILIVLARALGVEIPTQRSLKDGYVDCLRRMFDTPSGLKLMFALGRYRAPKRAGSFAGEGIDSLCLYIGERRKLRIQQKASITTTTRHEVRYDNLNKSGVATTHVVRGETLTRRMEYETGVSVGMTIWQGVKVTAGWRWDGEGFWMPYVHTTFCNSTKKEEWESETYPFVVTAPHAIFYDGKVKGKFSGCKTLSFTNWVGDKELVKCRAVQYAKDVKVEKVEFTPKDKGQEKGVDIVVPRTKVSPAPLIRIYEPQSREKLVLDKQSIEVARMFKGLGATDSEYAAHEAFHDSRRKENAEERTERLRSEVLKLIRENQD